MVFAKHQNGMSHHIQDSPLAYFPSCRPWSNNASAMGWACDLAMIAPKRYLRNCSVDKKGFRGMCLRICGNIDVSWYQGSLFTSPFPEEAKADSLCLEILDTRSRLFRYRGRESSIIAFIIPTTLFLTSLDVCVLKRPEPLITAQVKTLEVLFR